MFKLNKIYFIKSTSLGVALGDVFYLRPNQRTQDMVRESQMSGNAAALFGECLDGSLWAFVLFCCLPKRLSPGTRVLGLLLWHYYYGLEPNASQCESTLMGNSHHAMDGKLNVNPIQSTTYAELKLTYLFMKRAGHFQVDWRQEGGAMGFS